MTARNGATEFHLSTDSWVEILYELAATFHLWDVNRMKLLDLSKDTPLSCPSGLLCQGKLGYEFPGGGEIGGRSGSQIRSRQGLPGEGLG